MLQHLRIVGNYWVYDFITNINAAELHFPTGCQINVTQLAHWNKLFWTPAASVCGTLQYCCIFLALARALAVTVSDTVVFVGWEVCHWISITNDHMQL